MSKQNLAYYTCEDKPKPVAMFSERELVDILVRDAVAHHETDPIWFLAAIQRIAQKRRTDLDRAFLSVTDAAREAGVTVWAGAPGWQP